MPLTTVQSGMMDSIAQYNSFKNRIINGAMVISQRNAAASVTGNNAVFGVDRFRAASTQSSKFTMQQNAGAVTPPAGFKNYLGITSSSAYSVLSTDYFLVGQPIEGFNTADLAFGSASAATVTFSFWVRSSLTGTFGGSINNSAYDRSYPFSYTISAANTWEQKTITIAGDTTGTWIGATNGVGLYAWFNLGTGSTGSTTANAWAAGAYYAPTGATSVVGTNGATFYITGVQLEKGSTATAFDYRPYGTELQLCQRYFEKQSSLGGFNAIGGNVYWGSSTAARVFLNYQWKRATPTITYSGSGTLVIISAAGNLSITNFTGGAQNYSQAWVDLTSSGGTTGQAGFVTDNNSPNAFIAYSSEL